MRLALAASLLLPFSVHGINIIASNDDGWADINLRTFYNSLVSAGHSVVVSSPAQNMSGRGRDDPIERGWPCYIQTKPHICSHILL